MANDFSEELLTTLTDFLDEQGWHYTVDSEDGIIRSSFKLESKLKSYHMIVDVNELYYTVYYTLDISADEDCRREVAEFLTYVNYGLRSGNFEMDMRDGEVRVKIFIDCDDCPPTEEVLNMSFTDGDRYLNRYGNGLLSVMFGLSSPAKAYKSCE